jgi:hypothetical protein
MMHLAAMAVALAAMQDPVVEAIERAQKEYRMALVELGPDAIPELEKRADGPQGQFIKEAIEEIRRLKEPIEKLLAQMAAGEADARDLAAIELLRMGRPARSYLEKARDSRAGAILGQDPFKNRKPIHGVRRDLEFLRMREVAELQVLRVKAMHEEVKRGRATNIDLLRASREAEKWRYKVGGITRNDYLKSARALTVEELEWYELESARGKADALDVLKVRIQLLYIDRRLSRDVGEEINKAIREASRRIRAVRHSFFGRDYPARVLDQMFKVCKDRDEDLD